MPLSPFIMLRRYKELVSDAEVIGNQVQMDKIMSVKLKMFSYPSILTFAWVLKRTISLRRFY